MTWFGRQGVLARRLEGLEPLMARSAGLSVLDLGAAEGWIAREFCRRGARRATCVTLLQDQIEQGVRDCAGEPVRFIQADLNADRPEVGSHDVVLLLAILQKVREPAALLEWAWARARVALAIRVPSPVFRPKGRPDLPTFDLFAAMRGRLLAECPSVREGIVTIYARTR